MSSAVKDGIQFKALKRGFIMYAFSEKSLSGDHNKMPAENAGK
jgi:hypothetical protein